MPTWQTLPTLTNGGTPTAAQLNQYKGNMEYLHSQRKVSYEQTTDTDLTTTSTTWGTITNMVGTLVTQGGYVWGMFSCVNNSAQLDWSVDGTRVTSTGTAGTGLFVNSNAAYINHFTLPYLWTSLAAGTHVFAVQWRVPSGTGTIQGEYRPRFNVREL